MKKLNFGCGNDIKKGKEWDNVDIQKSPEVKSFDFNKFPYPIKDNTYDFVYTRNVLEHLDEPEKTIMEFWRMCKPNAVIEMIVPYYTNKGAYSSLNHKHFFNETAFEELIKQTTTINKKEKFKKIKILLVPSFPGKFFPRFLREKLSLFVSGLISEIYIKFEVIK